MSDEIIKPFPAFNNSLIPALNHINTKLRVKFDGSCLKQEKVTFTHKEVDNIYIVYEINLQPFTWDAGSTLGKSFFGIGNWLETLTSIDRFDARRSFSIFLGIGLGKNMIIYCLDMNLSVHIDNKKDTLILLKGLKNGLDHTMIYRERIFYKCY